MLILSFNATAYFKELVNKCLSSNHAIISDTVQNFQGKHCEQI